MIVSIKSVTPNALQECKFNKVHTNKYEIDNGIFKATSFTLQIQFKNRIVAFRNHDYKWIAIKRKCIANWYAPKIIKLSNNQIVQANQTLGIWEVNKREPHILLWHINIEHSKPIVNYQGETNFKSVTQAISKHDNNKTLAILFSNNFGIEISRSKIPFSAIACFTDHCDFDTLENLKFQRKFFKKHHIKTTKGFFLNQFSNRKNNASWELNSNELLKWIKDGHQLAYHSLSQSIKTTPESLIDFNDFKPPLKNLSTWIDHGYQPYNFTLYKNNNLTDDIFEATLKQKNIKVLWNYIDTGTAAKGVINQLNPYQFTLKNHWKGIKHLKTKNAISLMIKNIMFHFFNDEKKVQLYKEIAYYAKAVFLNKQIRKAHLFIVKILNLLPSLASLIIFWKTKSKEVYPLAKYTPLFFNHTIKNNTFWVFQTLEMVDFEASLCKSNVDSLIDESGLFVAHTYFSVPLNYHFGKLFILPGKIDDEVDKNFSYLSQKIQNKEIWNPTLEELLYQIEKMKSVIFDCSKGGEITVNNTNELLYREVK